MYEFIKRVPLVFVSGVLALFASTANADTLVVHNVRAYTLVGSEVRTYSGFVVENGKISRLLDPGAAVPSLPQAHVLGAGTLRALAHQK